MLPRLNDEERAVIETALARAERWAQSMDDHGQHDTVFHADVKRLRAALSAESDTATSEAGGLAHGE